jgi:hypothetical protein
VFVDKIVVARSEEKNKLMRRMSSLKIECLQLAWAGPMDGCLGTEL